MTEIPEENFRMIDWVRSKNPKTFRILRWNVKKPRQIDETDRLEKWLADRENGIIRVGPI